MEERVLYTKHNDKYYVLFFTVSGKPCMTFDMSYEEFKKFKAQLKKDYPNNQYDLNGITVTIKVIECKSIYDEEFKKNWLAREAVIEKKYHLYD